MTKYLDDPLRIRLLSYMTNNLDHAFAALSDPTRRGILQHLTRGPATVSALHDPGSMALPTFLRHLKVMEGAGLIRSEKRGRVRHVELEPAELARLQGWLNHQITTWNGRLDAIQSLAEDIERKTS